MRSFAKWSPLQRPKRGGPARTSGPSWPETSRACSADRVQLQQVVLNLLLNGLDAMQAVAGRPHEMIISTQREASERVRVAVQDSGPGIDPQLVSRVFEAFYTTKRSGMGMGLSISRTIVEQHGGRLRVVPTDGPGTTFEFTV